MPTVCIASGVWLVVIWEFFPQINLYYPDTQTQLLPGFIMMLIASTKDVSQFHHNIDVTSVLLPPQALFPSLAVARPFAFVVFLRYHYR
jgi:hypothetical protein